jgi:hypothetical protein
MRKQVKLTFNMGAKALSDVFKEDVIKAACTCSGGCFVVNGTGYWVEGETHAKRFKGEPQAEDALVIELTCEADKVEGVYADMQAEIAHAAAFWFQEIDWVHVTQVEMIGRHFSVAALNNAVAAE